MSRRKLHAAVFKAEVVLKGETAVSEPASRFGGHSTMINHWIHALPDGIRRGRAGQPQGTRHR